MPAEEGQHLGKDAAIVALTFMLFNNGTSFLCCPGLFMNIPGCNSSYLFRLSLLQPTAVLSPNIFQHPAPVHSSGYTSLWGHRLWHRPSVWGLTLSGLPHKSWLLDCSLVPKAPPSVPVDLPAGVGASWVQEPLLQLPSRAQFPSCFLFFPSIFHPYPGLSFSFRCPRSSDSVQWVLYENWPICRCILYVFVWRGKL